MDPLDLAVTDWVDTQSRYLAAVEVRCIFSFVILRKTFWRGSLQMAEVARRWPLTSKSGVASWE